MRRRTFLGTLTAGTFITAGCLQQSEGNQADSPNTTSEPNTTTEPESPARSTDTEESAHKLTITDVHAYSHAIRLNDLGTSPRGEISAVENLDDREQSVVREALGGTYRTDTLSQWLVDFLSSTPFVRQDGQYYRIESELPTTTITATAVDRSDVSGEIADYETYESAVTHDGYVRSGLLRGARQGDEQLAYVWPSLQAFLDQYDAVAYRGDVLDVSVTTDDPGSPYTATATEISLSEVAGDSVWRLSTADPAVQEVVRAGATESGLYAFDTPPDGLLEHLTQHRYVYVDGRFYTTYVEHAGEHPISLRATVEAPMVDSTGAQIRLALDTDRDQQTTITSGIPKPFGVLRYHERENEANRGLLWSDAYEAENGVQTDGREVVAVNSVAVGTRLTPNGTVGRTFTVDDIAPGQYVVENSVDYGTGPHDDGTFPYEVRFRVESIDE